MHVKELDHELALLGAVLDGGLKVAVEAVATVSSDLFTNEQLRNAWAVIETLATEGKGADSVEAFQIEFHKTWTQMFSSSSLSLVFQALDEHIGSASWTLFADYLQSARQHKTAVSCLQDLQNRLRDGLINPAEALAELNRKITAAPSKSRIVPGKDAAMQLNNWLEWRMEHRGQHSGIATGLLDLDSLLDGLQLGEQTVIGARPSIGKTAIAVSIATHACLHDAVPTLFVTCEMSPMSLQRRMFCCYSCVPATELRYGNYTERTLQLWPVFVQAVSHAPLFFLDCVTPLDVNRLATAIRQSVLTHNIRLVIVDYLQKIPPAHPKEKRTYEVAEVSGVLRSLAVDLKIALVTLAQINREPEKEKGRPPRISDLADSSQIERDADCIILMHRDRHQQGIHDCLLSIAKQRDGETGLVTVLFDAKHQRFLTKTALGRVETSTEYQHSGNE